MSPDGLAWSIQPNGLKENARGLNSLQCPFVGPKSESTLPSTKLPVRPEQPSSIDFLRLYDTELRILFPPPVTDPAKKLVFMNNDQLDKVTHLLDLRGTPMNGIGSLGTIWSHAGYMTRKRAKDMANLTNQGAFIIYGASVSWMAKEAPIIIEAFRSGPRSLLILGDDDCIVPQGVTRSNVLDKIDFDEIKNQDWQKLGAYVHYKWMRKEIP